jgi:hypothetical protein
VLMYLLLSNGGSLTRSLLPVQSSRSPTVDRQMDCGCGGRREARGVQREAQGVGRSA